MSSYVTVVYVNCWSWHVHGSHSVCLLKPGVTPVYCSRCMVIAPASLTLSPSVEPKVSMKFKYYEHLFMFIKWNKNVSNLFPHCHYLHSYVLHVSPFIFIYREDEVTSFMTFVRGSLCLKGDNVSMDEGPYPLTIVLLCSWCIPFENKDQHILTRAWWALVEKWNYCVWIYLDLPHI